MPTETAAVPAAPAAATTPAASIDYADIAKGFPVEEAAAPEKKVEAEPEERKPEEPKTDEKKEEPKVEEKKEEAKAEDEPFKNGFEKLVRAQKQFRDEREAAKHGFELADIVTPAQAASLKAALVKGDKLGVMTALGISYTDIAQAVVGASKGEAPKPVQPKETPAEQAKRIALESLPPEVQQVVQAYGRMQAQQTEQQVKAAIKEVITAHAPKLKHVAGLDAIDEVSAVLEEMFSRTGGLPSEDPRETIRIAAEEAELRLSRQASRWAKVLTPAGTSATIPASKAPVTPDSPAQSSGGKTLTNGLGASASRSPPAALDPESLYRDIAKGFSE